MRSQKPSPPKRLLTPAGYRGVELIGVLIGGLLGRSSRLGAGGGEGAKERGRMGEKWEKRWTEKSLQVEKINQHEGVINIGSR